MKTFSFWILFAALALCGCGSAPPDVKTNVHPACADGFVNETQLATGHESDSPPQGPWLDDGSTTLWDLWHAAQVDLSTNRIPYLDGHTVPPLPQAAFEEPKCQRVVTMPAQPGVGFACAGQMVGGCTVEGVVYLATYNQGHSVYEVENGILVRHGMGEGR